ncbi:Hydroxyquinol 1,2-dioxygenase [Grifola frondosa]|uniref:Hydroxyquinol 1,2-dioxygenase n=1 Tax=Grifola frondosa TaxID=5627 RepID=A0A1C7LTK2_GRIFR|nr:Hydroxyquinol 1,2-dioxygenase [Grifola frondosa]
MLQQAVGDIGIVGSLRPFTRQVHIPRDCHDHRRADSLTSLNTSYSNPLLVGTAIRAQLEHEVPQDLPLEKDFREDSAYTITDHVHQLHASLSKDPRTLQLITSLISHLHAFARETQFTHSEWTKVVAFLTRAGKESTDFKNEFVLLSDCIGLSALVDEINHPKPLGCTESCEPGPFYTEDAPEIPSGSSLAKAGTTGEAMFFSGTVKNLKGEGIKGARIDVWQADGDGIYDVQYPGRTEPNDRGRIVASPDGSFNYRGILPTAYPIPSDGPTGDFLHLLEGRHPHRASHIHFTLKAPGYDDLTTALYPSHSPFLGTDPVFATKKSLICELVEERNPDHWSEMGFKEGEVQGGRVWVWKYNFVLATITEVEQLQRARATKAL